MHELVLPEGFNITGCKPHYDRPVWRIRNGKASVVVYEIWRAPSRELGDIEGVLPQSEFGLEIHTAVAFLVSMVGLSMDKVCEQLKFFWELELSKSQADALLNQLSREWETEFESLCMLLAVSALVYADETSWSINSVWAFLSKHSRITVFGCRKDGDTLAVLMKKDEFQGILVSDDAAVYQGFSKAQKCWAHLLRKAIRLTLLKPERRQYETFVDSLLEIYRKGKAIAADKRLSEVGRRAHVEHLVDAVCHCTGARFADETKPTDEAEKDFFNLTHEIVRLMSDDELFTFVIYPEADGTNNISERQLRAPAQDRVTGRTNKTERGARRRTVITSVLDSLRAHVPRLTLKTVLNELDRWQKTGISCFRRLVKKLKLPALSLREKIVSPRELLVPLNKSPAR